MTEPGRLKIRHPESCKARNSHEARQLNELRKALPLGNIPVEMAIKTLRVAYTIPWSHVVDSGCALGYALGVRVTEDTVIPVGPVKEGIHVWEKRVGARPPKMDPRVRHPDNYERYFDALERHFRQWEAEAMIVGYQILDDLDDVSLSDEYEVDKLYSEGEISALVKPLAQFGYTWCRHPDAAAPPVGVPEPVV